MELPTYFEEFIPNISPSPHQRQVMVREHTKLRELLMSDKELKPRLLSTFIQGSQRRSTANRGDSDHPCDVDLVAVTNIARNDETAATTLHRFKPFLEEHYKSRYEIQDRSWCIKVDREVSLDLVPTSEPGSPKLRDRIVEQGLREWDPTPGWGLAGSISGKSATEVMLDEARRDIGWDKSEPLWIPDRKALEWEQTHPLYLIGWSAQKNLACNGYFAHVVKVIKWWRRHVEPVPKYPKGYPLEHLIAECCPNGITSVAAGVAATLAEIARRYEDHARRGVCPVLQARGIEERVDVMRRVTGEDFSGFHRRVVVTAILAKAALEETDKGKSAKLWADLLGPGFPPPPEEVRIPPGYTPPRAPARPDQERFA